MASTLRSYWVKAKKDVKAKDWESKVKFKDDLGPTLDDLEATVSKLDKLGAEASRVAADAEKILKKVTVTKKGYEAKINEAAHQDQIKNGDAEDIICNLREVVSDMIPERLKIAVHVFSSLSGACENMQDIAASARR